jgi:hypothetical protein
LDCGIIIRINGIQSAKEFYQRKIRKHERPLQYWRAIL